MTPFAALYVGAQYVHAPAVLSGIGLAGDDDCLACHHPGYCVAALGVPTRFKQLLDGLRHGRPDGRRALWSLCRYRPPFPYTSLRVCELPPHPLFDQQWDESADRAAVELGMRLYDGGLDDIGCDLGKIMGQASYDLGQPSLLNRVMNQHRIVTRSASRSLQRCRPLCDAGCVPWPAPTRRLDSMKLAVDHHNPRLLTGQVPGVSQSGPSRSAQRRRLSYA